jgi:tRNA nucleotidyltransferase/poly(A) polymerase
LRLCNPLSLVDDPVRVIRAVRYATELGLKIESKTKQSIIHAVSKLDQVSFERKRDELFKILETPKSFSAILLLQKFGILDLLGCGSSLNRIDQLRTYELLQEMLLSSGKKTGTNYFFAAVFLSEMSPNKKKLALFMAERNSNGHTRFQLDKFALLTSRELVAGKSGLHFMDIFSNEELIFINLFHRYESEVASLLNKIDEIDDRDFYRLFRQVGDSGVDLVLLGLAKEASKPAADLNQNEWLKILTRSARVFDSWFEHPEISQPRPFVNGDEIMMELKLKPGPLVGQLLETLKEEQAAGEITDREQAMIWLRQEFSQIKEK